MQKREKGFYYEQVAADYLKKKGYRILARNFYTYFGELDLVAQDGAYLVFVEVKYRADQSKGNPLEAVTAAKIRHIRRSAQVFLLRGGYPADTPCRFDVVGILGETITHISNAF